MSALEIFPVPGLGEIEPGADLAAAILEALDSLERPLHDGDIVVITQKVVSKAEGCLVDSRLHRAVAAGDAVGRAVG